MLRSIFVVWKSLPHFDLSEQYITATKHIDIGAHLLFYGIDVEKEEEQIKNCVQL